MKRVAITNSRLNSDWRVLKFEDCIVQLNTGLNPRNNFSLDSGKIKYITAKNLTKYGMIDFSKCDFVDNEAKKIINRRSDIKVGDVLLSSRAPIGHCHLIKEEPDDYDIGESIFSIRVKKDIVLPEYLCLYLASDFFVKLASKHTTGSIIQEIRVGDLMGTEVIVPPIGVQKSIADCLNAIDRKMALNEMVNDNLQQMAYTKYMHMFYGKKFNGKLDDIIVEQPKSSIQVGEAKEASGTVPFFTSGEAILKWPEALATGRNCFLNTGGNADVKFYVGESAYSTDTWCISAKNDMADYLYLLLDSIRLELNLKFFQGTGLKHLQKPLLRDRPIYIPSDIELREFNIEVKPWLSMISDNIRESEELISLRDWLLPMLMNGQASISD